MSNTKGEWYLVTFIVYILVHDKVKTHEILKRISFTSEFKLKLIYSYMYVFLI